MKALHVYTPSPNAKKAMRVNHLTGLNLPLQMLNLRESEQPTQAFLSLNPNGKIPVLELEDGSALLESQAIINFMSPKVDNDLWPASMDRYDIIRWQFWEVCHRTPACGKHIGTHLLQCPGIDMQAAAVEFHRFAAALDGHLAERECLVGDAMTTADIAVCCILAYKDIYQYPAADYDNILRWFDPISTLDA